MDYIVKAYKDWKLHSQFQEIVPDMDDTEFMFNEKQSIRDSSRTLKRYGSTCCNSMRNNETLIRHIVEKTDTLQGIALKYGCTTEQIRRANRLFASDSLFLRQFLLVPVEKTSPYYPQVPGGGDAIAAFDAVLATPPGTPDANGQREAHNNANNLNQSNSFINSSSSGNSSSSSSSSGSSSSCNTSGVPPTTAGSRSGSQQQQQQQPPQRPYSIAGELLMGQAGDEDPAMMHGHGGCGGKQSKSLDSVAAMTPEEENRKCMNDFLNKIDNTISESRKYVERSKDLVSSQSDADICVSASADIFPQRRHPLNNSYKTNNNDRPPQYQRHSSTGSGNSSDTAHLLNTTQTRRVQNSLKRLEKQQDDFFEL
ncbi:histone-lysine N-methyltransferase, H3 lysine-79 specific isoform X1 [Drosophila serrata]|uniref:histone-lysine N-methyltransferase, H3 lysine-79 specific isoform X1 n=2 Tax=Drosophila serrata TaxID=7274 RepID=UPI000A1D2DFC|nr:histone-lysine N-methyltransferase, H3 lysine-79 specific isoform X1 [Drosophila serrata]XP_020811918.1 histone-lysine N-methyltransferase, H3 lysine-79 specific isoform X1 [Drosophila serrata]XP_020811919.1 histone-lysine N-methyltransferase, H3 lysine-79 specific isoform X1 [Drosophila serrata]XP_020811920.1 histone-lysine N-methyltransferase, H3 lysine-79 specific isoform X1 [Drosophila serrata]